MIRRTFQKRIYVILALAFISSLVTYSQGSIRIDLTLAGDHGSSAIYLDDLRKEPFWGGKLIKSLDPFDYGEYKIEVYDKDSNSKIYSQGFCTLFEEWRTTDEARELSRSFEQSISFPAPSTEVRVEIWERDKKNLFQKKLEFQVNPASLFIAQELRFPFPSKKIIDNGDPSHKVDIAFIAEGYTVEEMEKFYADVRRLSDYLFKVAPFDQHKKDFNIWAVASVSNESGTDIPGREIWVNTIAGSKFYTFGLDRYLTTPDYWRVRDLAANVPYDQICVLVNTEKYGGGGIYNHYAVFSSGNQLSEKVFVHEFGHAFAGLGDEYWNSEVAYNDFFNLELEPWQPNLTTLVDFGSKWKDMLKPGVPVPTPNSWADNKGEDNSGDNSGENNPVIGVYQGGGYSATGIYRSGINCRMKGNDAPEFCAACRRAISKMIKYYND